MDSRAQPKKALGQNFLADDQVAAALVAASDPQPDDVYLEIGPGKGAVTRILASQVKKVIAVEFDRDLLVGLQNSLRPFTNISIINDDILHFICIDDSIHKYKFNKILGSIPYQVTSPLIHELAKLKEKIKIDSITLLVQKEVAGKMTAQPPQASYLSNFVQAYFDVQFVRNVSRESFRPIPKVDGAILALIPKPDGLNSTRRVEPAEWSAFLHRAFKFPRKMLKKVFDEKILRQAGIGPNQRPQEIELNEWQNLFEIYDWAKKRNSKITAI